MITGQEDLTRLKLVAESVKSFALVALVVGLLAMAGLQTVKDLLPIRKWFHKFWIKLWFHEGVRSFRTAEKMPPAAPPKDLTRETVSSLRRFREAAMREATKDESSPSGHGDGFPDNLAADVAVRDLVKLATAGDEETLFNLPIEHLCGQINAAVQLALEHADNHVVFLWCIGRFDKPDDFDEILSPPLELLRRSQSGLEGARQKEVDDYAGARARVTQRLQRAVDGFQIIVGSRWKLLLQYASIILSMLLAIVALHFTRSDITAPPPITGEYLLTVLGVGLAGGFIAPIARDILARLQTQRT